MSVIVGVGVFSNTVARARQNLLLPSSLQNLIKYDVHAFELPTRGRVQLFVQARFDYIVGLMLLGSRLVDSGVLNDNLTLFG